ncbi:hypothetical protein E6W36_10335 [Hankyongella ginsenosidimutans]|uniref:Transporter n=1 Tax=Hankyongella ginsenosidimutans TaxID=1763828 RepID=A0A4D7CC67_9SPHN|nr:hypothetical protein [Hankyongella ginsenosidimutans]QCI79792.1 hypothetical protein E6W36_10335 [Hankyongella ginsenosidimutans]
MPGAIRPKLTFSTGVDYSRGDFDADAKTSIVYAPFTTQLAWGDWSFGATIPYIRIEGPGAVVGGGDSGVVVTCGPRRQRLGLCPQAEPSAPQAAVTTAGGLGDLSFSAGYLLPEAWTGTWLVELQGRLKAPTASTRNGLGTGKVDYGIGVDIARGHGTVRPFINLGYRVLGDFTYVNPAAGEAQDVDFSNGPTVSAGTSVVLGTIRCCSPTIMPARPSTRHRTATASTVAGPIMSARILISRDMAPPGCRAARRISQSACRFPSPSAFRVRPH